MTILVHAYSLKTTNATQSWWGAFFSYTLIPISRKFAEVAFTIAITELMHYMYSKFNFFHNNINILEHFIFSTETLFFEFYCDIWHKTLATKEESLGPCNYRGSRETTVADCCYNPASALDRGQATRDTQNESTPGHYICRKGGICESCRMEWMNCHANTPKLKNEICRYRVYIISKIS